MPTISVIVPVYKVEPYLRRCVDSILNQTFTDFELLLVDDGSPDKCGAICDEYAAKDSRVHVIHKENGGVCSARNSGLRAAIGRYIAFCDSDDYLSETWLQSLYESIICDTDLVTAGFTVCDEIGGMKREVIKQKRILQFESQAMVIDFIIEDVLHGDVGWEIWAKLFRKQIIDTFQIRFCETCENFAEDLGFVLEYLLYCNQVLICDISGYYYMSRDNSMMATTKNEVKLNAVNEVSKQFGHRYLSTFYDNNAKSHLAVIHFLIMNNQYKRIALKENYPLLSREIKKIKSKRWFYKETFSAFTAYSTFCRYFGSNTSKKILLLSSYCLHGNWKVHTYLSAIVYNYLLSGA